MVSHYFYSRFDAPRRKRKIEVGRLLAPIFVSPIVFLPLASVLETSGSAPTRGSHLILLLVAFENGFFWREFFENRLKAHTAGETR